MNETMQGKHKGWVALIVAIVIFAMIGLWCGFVAWQADRTPVHSQSYRATEGTGDYGGAELARRIIVYQTNSAGAEIPIETEEPDSEIESIG